MMPNCIGVDLVDVSKAGWSSGYGSKSVSNYLAKGYFRTFFNYVYKTFETPVILTEFGFSNVGDPTRDTADERFDVPTSVFITTALTEVLRSIWEDGCQILGALVWTFSDDLEFSTYESRFGLQTVNRATQERAYKRSFFDFVDFMKARLPEHK